MMYKKLAAAVCFSFSMGSIQAQVQPTQTIEVEAKGTISFTPDSLVVKLYLDRYSVNFSNNDADDENTEAVVEMPVMMDSDFSTVVQEDAPAQEEETKTPDQLRKERERQRVIEDSLGRLRAMRLSELEAKLVALGVRFPNNETETSRHSYSSNTWVQNFTPTHYGKIDSVSRIYGRPMRLEMVDIKMKDHSILKERAYRQAIDNSKKEADALAKAMGRKVGKMLTVKTEAMDVMDLVPLMLRKEIQREIRKSDRFMQPALYQLSQQLGSQLFENDRYAEQRTLYWTWSEKINVTYQLN